MVRKECIQVERYTHERYCLMPRYLPSRLLARIRHWDGVFEEVVILVYVPCDGKTCLLVDIRAKVPVRV